MRQARSRQDDPKVEVLSELHDSAVLAHHRKSAKTRLEGAFWCFGVVGDHCALRLLIPST